MCRASIGKRSRAVIMASVVPPLTSPAREMVERYLGVKALVVEPGLETGMPILYDAPADVGADRIVNGIAAYEQYGRAAQCPLVVVDFGTATTLDAISAKGEYLGGAICPGVTISADALFQRAAGCRASTCGSPRPSSAGRPSAPWSRGCSGATSEWSKGWSGA